MNECLELRVREEYAMTLGLASEGKLIDSDIGIRKVLLPIEDPRLERIGKLDRELQASGTCAYWGWDYRRRYSRSELQQAELLHLRITAAFEPAGEECGTLYDESTACCQCGAGRTQVSGLVLDMRKVPKNKDIARTIADEWVVSQRLAELLVETDMTGFDLQPVRHKARYEDDPVNLARVPSGKQLLRRAEVAGVTPFSWPFHVWLNRREQSGLLHKAEGGYAELARKRHRRARTELPTWYQLIISSPPVRIVPPTRFGVSPFDDDPERKHVCPLGHVGGLNLLSELHVARSSWDGSDMAVTSSLVGARRGLLVPAPLVLISPRLWRLLKTEKMKGWKIEVAHLG
jgi:hypothetical protein